MDLAVLGLQLDSMIFKVFSNLHGSMIILFQVRIGFDQRNHHIILRKSGSLTNIL